MTAAGRIKEAVKSDEGETIRSPAAEKEPLNRQIR